MQCIGDVPPPDFAGGTVSDNCDPNPTVTHVSDVSDGNRCPEVITRTYRATDACGNWAECTQVITVDDTIAPVIKACPGNITVNADAGVCTAVVTWTLPTATDNCDPNPVVACSPPSGSTFGPGATLVTCTATDACGNTDSCVQTITVDAFNELVVDVELSPTMVAGSYTRCITFELWDCDPPTGPVVVTKDILFTAPGGGGVATGSATLTDVPCRDGGYECITA